MDTELRYEGWFKPFSVPFGLGPQQSDVSITNDSLHVSMGWGFRADIPLSSNTVAKPSDDRVYSWGVHGWRGRCPPVKGRVLGVPVTLKTLWSASPTPTRSSSPVARTGV